MRSIDNFPTTTLTLYVLWYLYTVYAWLGQIFDRGFRPWGIHYVNVLVITSSLPYFSVSNQSAIIKKFHCLDELLLKIGKIFLYNLQQRHLKLLIKPPTCKWPRTAHYSIIRKWLVSLEMLGWLSSTMYIQQFLQFLVCTFKNVCMWYNELTYVKAHNDRKRKTDETRNFVHYGYVSFYSSLTTNFPFIIRK